MRSFGKEAFALLLVLCGCSDARSSTTTDAAVLDNRPIEIVTWWGRGDSVNIESNPIAVLMKEHARRFATDVVITPRVDISSQLSKLLEERMARHAPPETFQASIGMRLMRWVLTNGFNAQASKLAALDEVMPEVAEWRRVLPPKLVADLSYGGKLYGVPATIHRENTIIYNKVIFERYGLEKPRSAADFPTMAKKLEGTGVTLFALGSREDWNLPIMLIEGFLVAQEGPEFYEDYFRGRLQPDHPRMVRALQAGLTAFDWINPDHRQINWFEAVSLVASGRSAMTVMGDWALTTARGMSHGQDVDEMAFPGAENVFVYTSDTFCLPLGAKNPSGAKRLLSTIGSKSAQEALNRAKGSIAPRSDVPAPADPRLAEKARLLHHGTLVLSLAGIVPQRFADALGEAMVRMLDEHDIEPVILMLKSRYSLLQ